MNPITLTDASHTLLESSRPLYMNLMNIAPGRAGSFFSFYESAGAVVVVNSLMKNEFDRQVYQICETSRSDMAAAMKDTVTTFQNVSLICSWMREPPAALDTGNGEVRLAGSCGGYADTAVRTLYSGDGVAFKALLQPADDEENPFASNTAACLNGDFNMMAEGNATVSVLGLFERGRLAGAVSYYRMDITACGMIGNLYVSPEMRGRGYAPRLIKSAMATSPFTLCGYCAMRGNTASVAAAKSAGMSFAGCEVYNAETVFSR